MVTGENHLRGGLTASSWVQPQERGFIVPLILEDREHMEDLVLPGRNEIKRIVFDVTYVDLNNHPDDDPVLELNSVFIHEIGYGSIDPEDNVYVEVDYLHAEPAKHQFSPEHQFMVSVRELATWFIMEYEDEFQFNPWSS